MRAIILFFAAICVFTSCTTSKQIANNKDSRPIVLKNVDRDGSSYNKAIIIDEKTERKGVDAEYIWLKVNYPGYKSKMQSLNFNNNKPYDIIEIVTADGQNKSIYFDISNFYGKL